MPCKDMVIAHALCSRCSELWRSQDGDCNRPCKTGRLIAHIEGESLSGHSVPLCRPSSTCTRDTSKAKHRDVAPRKRSHRPLLEAEC